MRSTINVNCIYANSPGKRRRNQARAIYRYPHPLERGVLPFMVTQSKASLTQSHTPEFCMLPAADLKWALTQNPSILQLFGECWISDPYGSRWMQLSTALKRTAFMEAKKQLQKQGLFIFKSETSIRDARCTVCWMVRNLHGSRVKEFWKESAQTDLESAQTDLESAQTDLESAYADSISPQTSTQQEFQNPSTSFHKRLNNSSKELLRRVSPKKTDALLRGRPKKVGEPEEEETPQAAIDCPTASGGIESLKSSASLLEKAEGADREPEHLGGDNCSAAAPNVELPDIAELRRVTKLKVKANICAQKRVREEARRLNPGRKLKDRELSQMREQLRQLELATKYQFYLKSGEPALLDEARQWAEDNPEMLP